MKVILETDVIGRKIIFIEMSKYEALKTIQSLSNQMIDDCANSGRYEAICEEDECFSIAVTS